MPVTRDPTTKNPSTLGISRNVQEVGPGGPGDQHYTRYTVKLWMLSCNDAEKSNECVECRIESLRVLSSAILSAVDYYYLAISAQSDSCTRQNSPLL